MFIVLELEGAACLVVAWARQKIGRHVGLVLLACVPEN